MELNKNIKKLINYLKNDLLKQISKVFIKMFDCCRE